MSRTSAQLVMVALAKTICKIQMLTFCKTCMLMAWRVKGGSNEDDFCYIQLIIHMFTIFNLYIVTND